MDLCKTILTDEQISVFIIFEDKFCKMIFMVFLFLKVFFVWVISWYHSSLPAQYSPWCREPSHLWHKWMYVINDQLSLRQMNITLSNCKLLLVDAIIQFITMSYIGRKSCNFTMNLSTETEANIYIWWNICLKPPVENFKL